MTLTAQQLWLIPALPLAAAAFGAVLPRRAWTLAAVATIGTMVLAFVLACCSTRSRPSWA